MNGREVALAEPKGMFLRRRLDITEQLGSAGPAGQQGAPAQLQRRNATLNATLTVLVAPPDNVGDVDLGCGVSRGFRVSGSLRLAEHRPSPHIPCCQGPMVPLRLGQTVDWGSRMSPASLAVRCVFLQVK